MPIINGNQGRTELKYFIKVCGENFSLNLTTIGNEYSTPFVTSVNKPS